MHAIRARHIADAFSRVSAFTVENRPHGIMIHYLGKHAYFVRESGFWSFAFNLGRANYLERQVAAIEAELTA
ncbi:MAG: hypothetical protein COW18_08525 [Zetaproteobacteria bacterium CG12_big_fil_rev_8_21_14_0_65_54_13]|nr:MAG: hypothetical protein COX55_03690 [Zetaproteobacteria bacterium CG23_combo_of_CG06-09_8_20_14_all_54_7]PIW47751.1 MAG: hypothetical protein COW18_08525 [Zetaproteobacteria bacterium CG12_big_fil_rev_8_21_14_0_65_54_13]PIX54486.1 MAG: hypothetical protein COZ50_07885 [Zetaproteobacteria bacterium CG_4_10_14_3_um_filter_54_28]PJA26977.1 MAG: hypothetical protein CO188_13545 [Zetaproteobacteria bacterium CG_4_9_14_3_um_filter_54_145]